MNLSTTETGTGHRITHELGGHCFVAEVARHHLGDIFDAQGKRVGTVEQNGGSDQVAGPNALTVEPVRPVSRGTKSRIFVSVAAYRDPELVATIENMLQMADRPGRLRVVVLNQDEQDIHIDLPGVEVFNTHFSEAKGLGWARRMILERYKGEDFVYQTDAHMRFAPCWDTRLIDCWRAARAGGVEKPLVSCYPSTYQEGARPWEYRQRQSRHRMTLKSIDQHGVPHFGGGGIRPNHEAIGYAPGVGMSGANTFAAGAWATRVPRSDEQHIGFEEPEVYALSWTRGYQTVSPVEMVAYHLYRGDASGRGKVWRDHKMGAMLKASRERVAAMYRGAHPDLGDKPGLSEHIESNVLTVRLKPDDLAERFGDDFANAVEDAGEPCGSCGGGSVIVKRSNLQALCEAHGVQFDTLIGVNT